MGGGQSKILLFFLVNQEVLPQVFTKVIQAKEYLRTAQAPGTTEAAKMAGISRSVFYKSKDAVYPYHGKAEKQIVTIQVVLYDRPGVLMAVISAFYNEGANILTINQNIPVNGTALVSIFMPSRSFKRLYGVHLLLHLKQVSGVQAELSILQANK